MRRSVWMAGLGLVAVAVGSIHYFFPKAPELEPLPGIQSLIGPAVIFAPHSDDETLAAGGLLEKLQSGGIQPRVVLVTAGDAFTLAAERDLGRVKVTDEQMVAFGRKRLTESQAALSRLGLLPGQLTFLGFPDRGTDRLWEECWDSPCRSSTTGAAAVPYQEAFRPGASYTGQELLREIVAILREVRPALVVYPHPNEAHVDHWGLANFVEAALEELRRTDPAWTPPTEWHYLVHRGDWPAPKGYRPSDSLLPPAKLVGGMTQWHMEPLTLAEVSRKTDAMNEYHTQVAILRRYMESFVRANELFGEIERTGLPAAAAGPGPATADVPPWKEFGWVPFVTDPRADTVAREVERGTDLRAVWAARSGDMLYLAAQLTAKPGGPAEVRFLLRSFTPAGGWSDMAEIAVHPNGTQKVLRWPGGSGADAVRAAVAGNWVRIGVPQGGAGAVMVGVETHLEGLLIDRSAWRPLALDGR